jgi:steroid delta-isomerase-like uncharacterized protein
MCKRNCSAFTVGAGLLIALTGLSQAAAADTEANKAIAQRIFNEIWNQGNLSVVDEIIAADLSRHDPGNPSLNGAVGSEGFKQLVSAYRSSFPDIHWTVEDTIAEGDLVAARWTSTGTHQGELAGIPPTGASVAGTGISILRIAEGKVEEEWASWDALAVMQQLGVIVPPRAGPESYVWGTDSRVEGDPGDPALNRVLVIRVVTQFWNGKDIGGILETHSQDAIAHNPVIPGNPLDFAAYQQACLAHLAALPDFHVATEAMIAEADKVVVRWTVSGTQQGELMGMPASGNSVEFKGITIYRLADNNVVESWWAYDALGMMQQITASPEWPIEGTWMAAIPTPLGNMIVKCTYAAQDAAKTKFTPIIEQINQVPVLIELYPELDRIKFAGGQVLKTGVNTYEATLIEYLTAISGPGSEDIVGLAVITGNMVLSGPDTAAGQGTGAYYVAAPDADHDGFPDAGEEPVLCMPWSWTKKRLTMMPGCVPAP